MRGWRLIWVAFGLACCMGPAAAQVVRYDGTDMPGNDLGDLTGRARSYDDCAQRCLTDGRCAAFTYNLNNRVCYPKSSGSAPQRNARAVSGLVDRTALRYRGGAGRGDVRGVTRRNATDAPGNDLQDMIGQARSYEDCAQRCLADGRCGAFTFNLDNGVCYPKAFAGPLQHNDRAVSGLLDRSRGPGPGRPFEGGPGPGPDAWATRYDATDFPGNDLPDAIGAARSYEDCAQRCAADGRCGAFTFNQNNGVCYPKSSAGASQRNDRAVSGVVRR